MGKPVVLLGAGASIDAGLHDTNRLTREIYRILSTDRFKVPAQVFGYVISKILTRKVRKGESPFSDVNVEEVYDGVERLVFRESDIVSEFVSSWDPFLDGLRPSFDTLAFIENIERGINLTVRKSLSQPAFIEFDQLSLRRAAEEIARATSPSIVSNQTDILQHLMKALLQCLQHDPAKIEYMHKLTTFISDRGGIIGSLNYDLVTENSLSDNGLRYDYGLSWWNSKKLVSFTNSRAYVKLIKLHGSMN